MGKETVTIKELYKFLCDNDFSNVNPHGHNTIVYNPTGETITINWHRSKGKRISHYTIRDIAKVLGMTKRELVLLIKKK